MQALYGHGEKALIEGITPINPLDVLDLVLLHRKADAFILDTWTRLAVRRQSTRRRRSDQPRAVQP